MPKTVKEQPSCLDAAVALLARREHAVKELEAKLLRKYAAVDTRQVIEKLIKNNLLSDERYAATRVNYRAGTSRWGPARIRQELRAKGVPGALAEAALSDALAAQGGRFDGAKKTALAHKRAKAATPRKAPADPALGGFETRVANQKAYDKLLARLMRKGFSLSEAKAAIAEAEAE